MARLSSTQHYPTMSIVGGETVQVPDFSQDSRFKDNWADNMYNYVDQLGVVQHGAIFKNSKKQEWCDVLFKNGDSWAYPTELLRTRIIGACVSANDYLVGTDKESTAKTAVKVGDLKPTPTIIRVKQKKITIIPANLPNVTGVQPKKRKGCDGLISLMDLENICCYLGQDMVYTEELRCLIEEEYASTYNYFGVYAYGIDLTFVKQEGILKSIEGKLFSECPEYLGGWNLDYIKEAFQRVRGHKITNNVLDSLVESSNYLEIGLLMHNTKGVIKEFVNVLLHKHNKIQVIGDVFMQGEAVEECVINNTIYYYGGY